MYPTEPQTLKVTTSDIHIIKSQDLLHMYILERRVVELLSYAVEPRGFQIAVRPVGDWTTMSIPEVNEYFFLIREGKDNKRVMGSVFHMLCKIR